MIVSLLRVSQHQTKSNYSHTHTHTKRNKQDDIIEDLRKENENRELASNF